jgi:hypothetical protein
LKNALQKKVEIGILVGCNYSPRFGTWCNTGVGVTVEVITLLSPGRVIGNILMEKRM